MIEESEIAGMRVLFDVENDPSRKKGLLNYLSGRIDRISQDLSRDKWRDRPPALGDSTVSIGLIKVLGKLVEEMEPGDIAAYSTPGGNVYVFLRREEYGAIDILVNPDD